MVRGLVQRNRFQASRLVVGAGAARATERAAGRRRPGGLVVDVEVAGREPQLVRQIRDRGFVLGKMAPVKAVDGALVTQAKRAVEIRVVVNERRHDWAE
jgi:hypothetical protein